MIRCSAHSPRLLALLERPERKLLVYHNVTPPGYFWNHHPGVAVACAVGRAQLPLFARAVDVCAADSDFNAGDLRAAGADARVLPILFDPARLEQRGRAPEGDGPLVLVVSRLAPNKRHDLAIAAFDAWRAEHGVDPPGMLCVGEPVSPSYAELIGGPGQRFGHAGRRAGPAGPERRLRCGRRDAVDVRARGLLGAAAGGLPLRPAGGGAARRGDARGGRRRRAVGPRRTTWP